MLKGLLAEIKQCFPGSFMALEVSFTPFVQCLDFADCHVETRSGLLLLQNLHEANHINS